MVFWGDIHPADFGDRRIVCFDTVLDDQDRIRTGMKKWMLYLLVFIGVVLIGYVIVQLQFILMIKLGRP